jgi:hypothetical protein
MREDFVPKHKSKVKASVPKKVVPLPKIDIEKLKKMYGPIRDAQLKLRRLNTPQPIVVPGPSEQELKSLATKMGIDPQMVEKSEADRQKVISQVIAERQADSIKQAASVRKQLNSAAAGILGGINNVATLGSSKRYLVNEPISISPPANVEFEGSTISPGNSVAQFQVHAIDLGSSFGTAAVDYYFRWQNPSNYGTLISADALVLLHGTAKAATIPGWDTSTHDGALAINVGLDVAGFWNPTFESLGSGSANALTLIANSEVDQNFFYQHTVVKTANVLEFLDVQAKGPIAVPANGVVLLVVSISVNWGVDAGSIDVDFGPDPFNVMSPGVIVTQWV